MIRLATEADLPIVYDLCMKGLEERGYEYDEELVKENIYRSFLIVPCFIVEKEQVIGCASMDLGTTFYSSKYILTSNMVYVLPKHRNVGIINELYKAIRKYADLQGIRYDDTFYCNDKIDVRMRLATRQGLEINGINISYGE